MSAGRESTCDVCGHPKAMGQCWRLTCPTNGGSMELVEMAGIRAGKTYEAAKRLSAAAGRSIAFGHPAQWPMPRGEAAQDAYERDLFASQDDEDDL